MKNTFLMVFVFATFLVACSNNGEKAVTKEAEKVAVEKTGATTTYKTINAESHIKWRASHLGGLQKRFGKVKLKGARCVTSGNNLTSATVIMDLSSLTVESFNEGAKEGGDLADHLKSDDFFNIEKYPTSRFELVRVAANQGDYNSTVTGNLTILNISKSITFKANITITDDAVSVKSEDFSVNRNDWGLSYHIEGSPGVPVDYLIADDMGFTIDVSLSK